MLGFAHKEAAVYRSPVDYIMRVHRNDLSERDFIERFERPGRPVIIKGLTDSWGAKQRWTLKALCRDFGDVRFKCGEDDDGYSVKMRMKRFIAYMAQQKDDSPLYVFDSTFDERKETTPLRDDYTVPVYFRDNLWRFVPKDDRPPHRWFLVGPKRSGTTVHIDPLGTSAWNTLLSGRKRWVVFSPSTPKSIVKGKKYIKRGDDDEAISYFSNVLPQIRKDNTERENMEMYEFIQYAGETIYIPGGWWHAVYNLDDTVAVTHNYVNAVNFARVWRKTRSGRFKMAPVWLKRLQEERPELARLARQLDEEDNFDWKAEGERRQKKKARKKERKRRRKEEEKRRKSRNKNRRSSRSRSRSKGLSRDDRTGAGKRRRSCSRSASRTKRSFKHVPISGRRSRSPPRCREL